MKLKQLLHEDDAVSPVIGVILMVAITVILAAVIATFVLGLGEQVSQTAPNANFQFDFNQDDLNGSQDSWGTQNSSIDSINESNNDGLLTVTHTSGPAIDTSAIGAVGSNYSVNTTGTYDDWSTINSSVTSSFDDDEVSAGEEVDIWIADDDSISVVWENEGDSATLAKYNGPDA